MDWVKIDSAYATALLTTYEKSEFIVSSNMFLGLLNHFYKPSYINCIMKKKKRTRTKAIVF